VEHRWGKRVPLDLAVTLHLSSGAVAYGRMVNASLSGALVRTNARVAPLSRVVMELDSDAWQHARPLLIPAYAIREAADWVALEWTEFSPPALAALLSRPTDRLAANAKLHPDENEGCAIPSLRGGLFEQQPWR